MPDLYSQENSDQHSQPRGPTGGKKTRAGPGAVRGYLVKLKEFEKLVNLIWYPCIHCGLLIIIHI